MAGKNSGSTRNLKQQQAAKLTSARCWTAKSLRASGRLADGLATSPGAIPVSPALHPLGSANGDDRVGRWPTCAALGLLASDAPNTELPEATRSVPGAAAAPLLLAAGPTSRLLTLEFGEARLEMKPWAASSGRVTPKMGTLVIM